MEPNFIRFLEVSHSRPLSDGHLLGWPSAHAGEGVGQLWVRMGGGFAARLGGDRDGL